MRIIWDELESYKPDPMCTCDPKCMCDGLSSVMERKKQDREMSFLRGLNDQFNMVRSNVLMMDPLPSIAKVFSCVVQQERRISSNDLMGGDNLINATSSTIPLNLCTYCGGRNNQSGSGRGSSSGRGSKIFTHFGFTNHTIDECYKKHGYPPGHKLYKP
ncbi:hypothetical protein JHK85_010666 [Glycine max]|uniref:Uncharacterized protein n=1 Tax=Glycine max TaxID=3847 RepID=A0A0R0K8W7_SOYBN|nr:hypothetical protein JHK87_010244 [Glycine soja]KAG5049563.1 hypothetical protein JHK85_010666 [Glycine max]KAG5066653.1 hypothetical protein JHK86_010384 [Glycine max]KAH1111602.1 hypothetical protein GYH30_010116 [Glycine max]